MQTNIHEHSKLCMYVCKDSAAPAHARTTNEDIEHVPGAAVILVLTSEG